MKITTYDAQISVEQSGASISRISHGYAAKIQFWGKSVYLVKEGDYHLPTILIVPDETWEKEILDDGYEIICKLSDIKNTPIV